LLDRFGLNFRAARARSFSCFLQARLVRERIGNHLDRKLGLEFAAQETVQSLLLIREGVFDDGKLIESFCALSGNTEAVSLQHCLLLQASTSELLQPFKVAKRSAGRCESTFRLHDG